MRLKTESKLLATLLALSLLLASPLSRAAGDGGSGDPDPDYDRLDGHGKSGKTVQVIEWEGNLEIHVYPVGSLKGLALKLDERNKGRPVMVIGYRFKDAPQEQLIRRAIVSIGLRNGFKAYRDPSADDYDKIVISNNGMASPLVAYQLEPAPTQLYPDGALASGATPPGAGGGDAAESRGPAGAKALHRARPAAPAPADDAAEDAPAGANVDDAGAIKPFFSK